MWFEVMLAQKPTLIRNNSLKVQGTKSLVPRSNSFLFPYSPADDLWKSFIIIIFIHLDSTGYFCKCPASFVGTHCEIGISPCASNPCLYGGTCMPRADDFYCQCRGQYSGQRYLFFIEVRSINIEKAIPSPHVMPS